VLADTDLHEASDAWLGGNTDAVPALRRLVSENRDAVARALRVQARDHES
jgi:aminopeptidase N